MVILLSKYCGQVCHARRQCPAFMKTCFRYDRQNHFSSVCRMTELTLPQNSFQGNGCVHENEPLFVPSRILYLDVIAKIFRTPHGAYIILQNFKIKLHLPDYDFPQKFFVLVHQLRLFPFRDARQARQWAPARMGVLIGQNTPIILANISGRGQTDPCPCTIGVLSP